MLCLFNAINLSYGRRQSPSTLSFYFHSLSPSQSTSFLHNIFPQVSSPPLFLAQGAMGGGRGPARVAQWWWPWPWHRARWQWPGPGQDMVAAGMMVAWLGLCIGHGGGRRDQLGGASRAGGAAVADETRAQVQHLQVWLALALGHDHRAWCEDRGQARPSPARCMGVAPAA